MDNKIYNLNFWWSRNNYGANLTAFALQNLLVNSELVNNSSWQIEMINKKWTFAFNFQKKYLKTTKQINKNCEQLNNNSNIFITGSDQVFRPIYMQNKIEQYLLDFAKTNSKKIAFSASFGVDKEQFIKENSNEAIEHIKNSLKSFDFISVREKSGVEICKDVLDVDAQWIIDPVFIFNNWDKLLNNATKNYQNKIISYVLDNGKEYKKAYKYLSKKYNCKVIETANSNISIENWLKSIKDCELFVTDSFHGMCFAIIFNKPFICLANKSRGRSRFDSICEMLDIKNQCVDSILEILEKDCVFKIDYKKTNSRIEYERQRGLEFIQKSLETPIQTTQAKINSRMTYLENRIVELEKECNLKTQLKKSIWNSWLKVFYCLPKFARNIIQFLRGKRK